LKTSPLAEPTFIGRKNELSELQRYLDSMLMGEGSTVFISGEAGSGKTRISKEFLESAKNKGVIVPSGWCLSGAAVPYFPFIEAFNSLNYDNQQLKGIFSGQERIRTTLFGENTFEESSSNQFLNPSVWKDQVFAAITKELLLISTGKPTILFIDDIHWADSASLALLHYIARAISSERILILATFRNEEILNNVEGQLHQLAEVLGLMGRESLYAEIKLSNLSQIEVGMVAQDMLGGNLSDEFAEKLSRETQGNPLFVVESLRMMHSQGSIIQDNRLWKLAKKEIVLPQKMRDVILRRLNLLKPNQRRILDVASIIGEKFDPNLIGPVISEKKIDVLETLSDISQSTLLIYGEDDCFRFKHAKIQEMLCKKMEPLLKKEYHLAIADALVNNSPALFSDIAHHYVQANSTLKAVHYSLAAGQEALKRWSNVEAVKHFSYVLEIVKEQQKGMENETIALEGLGDAYYANSDFKEAAETFEHLSGIQTGADKLRALRKAMFAAMYEGDLFLLQKYTKLAEENATANRLEAARVLHQKARVIGFQGDMSTCLPMLDKALVVFEEEYALEDAAWILFAAGHASTSQNQLEKGVAASLRSIALYDEIGDINSQMEAYLYAGLCFSDSTLNKESIDMYKKVLEINEQRKVSDYIRLILAYECLALSTQGDDLENAISKTLLALDLSEKTNSHLYLGLIYSTLVMQFTIAGNLDQAEEYFKKLNNLPQEMLLNVFSQVLINLAKAIYFAGKNEFEKSDAFFIQHFSFLMNNYRNPGSEATARQAYAWALSRQGKAKEAELEIEKAHAIIKETTKRFEHVNVNAALMVCTSPKIDQAFEIRLVIVNVSRSQGSIISVDNLLIPGVELLKSPSSLMVKGKQIEFREQSIAPFQVKTIKLSARITQAGTYLLTPTITYMDELKKTTLYKPRPIIITVQHTPVSENIKRETEFDRFAIASVSAKNIIDYLSKSFKEDYFLRLLTEDKAGWRSLMQIVRENKATKHSLYGQDGHGGKVLAELKRLGLIEVRLIEGEPGRSGRVRKIRICPNSIRVIINDQKRS
jgi:predicted ATPase